MRRFRIRAFALATAAVLAAGCHGCRSKTEAVDTRRVERLASASRDSLVRIVVAAIDSPEIVIARLDSPRTFVKISARRATVADSTSAYSGRVLTAEDAEESRRKSESSTTPLSHASAWTLVAIVALLALAAEIAFRRGSKG